MRRQDVWFPGRGLPTSDGGDGALLAGYDLNANRVLIPAWVRAKGPKFRSRWMTRHGLVLPVGGGDDFHYCVLSQPFLTTSMLTVSNSTVEGAISSDTFLTLGANAWSWPGKRMWLHCAGPVSNVVTTPGTLTLRVRWGGSAGTLLATTGAIPFSTTAATNNLCALDCFLTCIAQGPTTTALTLRAYGTSWVANTAGTAAALQAMCLPPAGTALADVASLDGTVPKAITVTAQFSVNTSPTNIQITDCWLMALN